MAHKWRGPFNCWDRHLWSSWRRRRVKKDIRRERYRFIHALFCKIWEEMNNRIFNNSIISSNVLALKVDTMITFWAGAWGSKQGIEGITGQAIISHLQTGCSWLYQYPFVFFILCFLFCSCNKFLLYMTKWNIARTSMVLSFSLKKTVEIDV